jgi:GNAT superfamily N-acetyltransferase
MPPPLRQAAALGLSYRAMTEADEPFTAAVYASTRTEELAPTGWPEQVKQAFLAQQHRAQHDHYRTHFADGEWLAVVRHGADVGRLYLSEGAEEIRLVDIALLPGHRGAGIGRAIVADLLAWAQQLGKEVTLHVEPHNPVRALYLRLGFEPEGEEGAYQFMRWRPKAQ